MSRLHAFTGAASTSIAAGQPHRKTQILSSNIKHDRCHQPNICAAAPLFHLHSQLIKPKSVTEPLNEAVRPRLCGKLETTNTATHCRTSGSDHDIDTESFGDMICGYWSVGQHRLQREWSPFDVESNCEVTIDGLVAPSVRKQLCQMLELPVLFVGREGKLIEIIKIMCDATRRSLKERGMYMPPWRKYGYMQAQWVGWYKRTTNLVPRATPQGSSLQFPFSGITLKGMQCDARVDHQREKAKNAADRNLEAKSKSTDQGNNQLEQRDRYENKISGLAMALAEAALTPSSPSIGTWQSDRFI